MSTSKVLYLSDSYQSLEGKNQGLYDFKGSGHNHQQQNSSSSITWIFQPPVSLNGEGRNEEDGEKV